MKKEKKYFFLNLILFNLIFFIYINKSEMVKVSLILEKYYKESFSDNYNTAYIITQVLYRRGKWHFNGVINLAEEVEK